MPNVPFNTTDEQRQAAVIIDAHNRRADSIRHDQRLSDEGKRAHLAANYLHHKGQVDTVKAKEADRTTSRRNDLQRQLFGAASDPSTVVAFRDAQDRAGKHSNVDEAQAALDRAHMTGDHLMAKAVALNAADRGWGGVLQSYALNHPEVQAPLDELSQLTADSNSKTAAMGRAMSYSITLPRELSSYRNTLPQLAAQAPGVTATENPSAGDTSGDNTWRRFFGGTA